MHRYLKLAARSIHLLIFALTFALFAWHLGRPTTLDFDETHYVPAAKDLLNGVAVLNLEHPPLAKYFMAIGIGVFGDNPIGWRIMSVLFGSLTMVAVVALAEAFEFSLAEQWMIAALTLTNSMLFVMARECMLDIFMLFYLVAATAAFVSFWRERENSTGALFFCGLSFGLALACKWSTLYSFILPVGLTFVMLISLWRHPKPSTLKDSLRLIGAVFILPLVIYYLAYLPLWIISHHDIQGPVGFWRTQVQMYITHTAPMKPHNYESKWFTWPILYRPIWFKFESVPNENLAQTTFLIGNPWLAWCGLLALGFCIYDFLKNRSWVPGLIALFYLCSFLGWSLVTRQVQFLYYYLPAYTMLGFACIFALRKWPRLRIAFVAVNILFFLYFYPIISGGPIFGSTLNRWMWLHSWY